MDLPTSLVSQQRAARPRSPEELEAFGKYAAAKYHRGGGKLTDVVVETIKQAGLSPEQVRRVVEFTNQAAYLTEFQKEGSAHKVVYFPGGPADPVAVLQDLNDGGGGTVYDDGSGHYQEPPRGAKLAAKNRAFSGVGTDPIDVIFAKSASVSHEEGYSEPFRDLVEAKDKIAAGHARAVSDLLLLEAAHVRASNELIDQVKIAVMRGAPLSHVVGAFGQVRPEPELVKAAFEVLTEPLVRSGLFQSPAAIADSVIEKTASIGVVNRAHPLLGAYGAFAETHTKLAAVRDSVWEHKQALNTIDEFFKEASASSAGATAGKLVSGIPKAWRAATSTTAKAAPKVQKLTRDFLEGAGLEGSTADSVAGVVGKGVKYSPHFAAGVAGEEAYQHAKYSPGLRQLQHAVLSRVPYTRANMMRQYRIQSGMMY